MSAMYWVYYQPEKENKHKIILYDVKPDYNSVYITATTNQK